MDPLALIPLTAVFVVCLFLGRNELVRRRLKCPRTGTEANVDVVQRFRKSDKPVKVASCDLLSDSKKVDCGQGCLDRVD